MRCFACPPGSMRVVSCPRALQWKCSSTTTTNTTEAESNAGGWDDRV